MMNNQDRDQQIRSAISNLLPSVLPPSPRSIQRKVAAEEIDALTQQRMSQIVNLETQNRSFNKSIEDNKKMIEKFRLEIKEEEMKRVKAKRKVIAQERNLLNAALKKLDEEEKQLDKTGYIQSSDDNEKDDKSQNNNVDNESPDPKNRL